MAVAGGSTRYRQPIKGNAKRSEEFKHELWQNLSQFDFHSSAYDLEHLIVRGGRRRSRRSQGHMSNGN